MDKWSEVMSACDEIFDDFSDAAYASDEVEIDAIGRIEALAELVSELIAK